MILVATALAVASMASPAGVGTASPSAGAQTIISVPVRETTLFAVSPSASWMVMDEKVVEVTRARDGLQLRGLERGETILFVGDGSDNRVYTLSVVNPAPVSTFNPQLTLTAHLESQLGISTGGWIQTGSIGLNDTIAAARGVYSRALSLALSGNTPALAYSIVGSGLQYEQSVQTVDLDAAASGKWGQGHFGIVEQPNEFRPVLWGRPYRESSLVVTPGDWSVGASARALYQFERPSFSPAGWRGFAERHWDSGASSSVGVIEGNRPGASSWLPYVGGGYESGRFGAQGFVGHVAGAAAEVAAGQLHASAGPCLLTASYTTGLRGPDAPAQRAALLPYLDPNQNAFNSTGQCHAGEHFVFGGGAYRGGTPSPSVDTSAVLASGFVSWNANRLGAVNANVQWSVSGRDLRNFAAINGLRRFGNWELSANAVGSRPSDDWYFNETATLRRYIGVGSLGFSSGLSHMSGPPQSVFTSVDGSIDTGALRATVGGQASFNLQLPGPPLYQLVGQLELRPFSAYSLRAYTYADPMHLERWNLNLGFAYFFGDSQPREPMLRPFRSSSIEAIAFEDRNGNGVRDAGEPALAGVKICVDRAQCGVTGADGRWSAAGLEDGTHRVVADGSALEGTAPTTDPVASPAVGTYRTPRLVFGFRYHADLIVHAFLDRNGNGKRDAGEEDLVIGKAIIRGPAGLLITAPLGNARAEVFEKGDVSVSLDVGSLPAGYMAEVVRARVPSFARTEVEVPVRLLRALGGRICIDQNGDGLCGPTELTVGLVRVTNGREEVVADDQGNFLFTDLPPGKYGIRVREEDLPAGTRQPEDLKATLADGPGSSTTLMLPLEKDLFTRRSFSIALPWPSGPAPAREVGGLYLRASSLDSHGAPAADAQKDLRRLVRAGRGRRSRMLITVYSDATAFLKDAPVAQAHALATGRRLAGWLGLNDAQVIIESKSPTDDEEMVDVRLYRKVD